MNGNRIKNKITLLIVFVSFMIGYWLSSTMTKLTEQTITIYPDDYFTTKTTGYLYEESPTNIGTGEIKRGNIKKQQTSGISIGHKGETKSKSGLPKDKVQEGKQYTIKVKGFPDDSIANRVVNKVYNEVGIDMVLTLIGENGTFRIDRKSMIVGSNGYSDYGLCQLNYQYHKKFIDSKDFNDREKQTDYCIGVWRDAVKKDRLYTTFYAYKMRDKRKDRIILD